MKDHLSDSSEKHHTRILAILMQNDGVMQKFRQYSRDQRVLPYTSTKLENRSFGDAPQFSKTKALKVYLKDIGSLLLQFSFRNEWNWLKFRLGKIAQG